MHVVVRFVKAAIDGIKCVLSTSATVAIYALIALENAI